MDESPHNSPSAVHSIDDRVHALMDSRLQAARLLADASTAVADAQAALDAARSAYESAWKGAHRAGWDAKDLTEHLDFEEPGATPRRRRSPRKKTAPADVPERTSEGNASTSA